MFIPTNTFDTAGGLRALAPQPLDAKYLTANQVNRLSYDANDVYNGMQVFQVDTGEVWILQDATSHTSAASWELLGNTTAESIEDQNDAANPKEIWWGTQAQYTALSATGYDNNTEYNIVGPGITLGDLGITATAAELNQLDGVTLGDIAERDTIDLSSSDVTGILGIEHIEQADFANTRSGGTLLAITQFNGEEWDRGDIVIETNGDIWIYTGAAIDNSGPGNYPAVSDFHGVGNVALSGVASVASADGSIDVTTTTGDVDLSLADDAVTNGKIADGAITVAKINAGAVTTGAEVNAAPANDTTITTTNALKTFTQIDTSTREITIGGETIQVPGIGTGGTISADGSVTDFSSDEFRSITQTIDITFTWTASSGVTVNSGTIADSASTITLTSTQLEAGTFTIQDVASRYLTDDAFIITLNGTDEGGNSVPEETFTIPLEIDKVLPGSPTLTLDFPQNGTNDFEFLPSIEGGSIELYDSGLVTFSGAVGDLNDWVANGPVYFQDRSGSLIASPQIFSGTGTNPRILAIQSYIQPDTSETTRTRVGTTQTVDLNGSQIDIPLTDADTLLSNGQVITFTAGDTAPTGSELKYIVSDVDDSGFSVTPPIFSSSTGITRRIWTVTTGAASIPETAFTEDSVDFMYVRSLRFGATTESAYDDAGDGGSNDIRDLDNFDEVVFGVMNPNGQTVAIDVTSGESLFLVYGSTDINGDSIPDLSEIRDPQGNEILDGFTMTTVGGYKVYIDSIDRPTTTDFELTLSTE